MFHRLVTLQLYGAENTIADRSIISLSTVKRINITYSSKFAGIFTQNNPVTKVKNVSECLHSGDVLKDEVFFTSLCAELSCLITLGFSCYC